MTQTTTPERKLNLGRLERLQRLLQYGAMLVLLVFVVLIGLAWTGLRDLNTRKAKAAQDLADVERKLKTVNDELALKQKSLEAAQSVNSVLSNVADAYKEENPEKAELINAALREAAETTVAEPAAGQGGRPAETAAQVPPRVYIQVMNAGQLARAREVTRKLQAQGFLVPGVENMERKGHRQSGSDVRFNPADEWAAKDTEAIRAVLGEFKVRLKDVRLGANTRPRQYELWLGDDFVAPEGPARPDVLPGLILTRPVRPKVSATPADQQKTTDGQKPADGQKTDDRRYTRRTSP